jgi:hypothetical protein
MGQTQLLFEYKLLIFFLEIQHDPIKLGSLNFYLDLIDSYNTKERIFSNL